jgi:hypothetical protein
MPKQMVGRGGGYLRDGEKSRAYNKSWRASKSKEYHFDRGLIYRYDITIDHYYDMLDKQGGLCAICKTIYPGYGKQFFCVDHCHETGDIRGLLCNDCNIALGRFKDNVETIAAALEYLSVSKI